MWNKKLDKKLTFFQVQSMSKYMIYHYEGEGFNYLYL
jgi:hypothetical protein